MEKETALSVQISTSISDDTAPDIPKSISSSSNQDSFVYFNCSGEKFDQMDSEKSKAPFSVPSEVAKVSDISKAAQKVKLLPNASNRSKNCSPSNYVKNSLGENKLPAEGLIESNGRCDSSQEFGITHKQTELTSSSTDEESTSTSNFSSGKALQWTEKKTSRVGMEYQASSLPDAGSYLNLQEDDFDQLEQLLLADQIWDPLKATCRGINDYVHFHCPSNKKEAALELLHQRDYDDTHFIEELQSLPVLDGSDWSLIEHENFRKLMQSTRHNVHSVAKSMGKTVNNCLTVYYKIINVRETRSTKKRFSGMKAIEEINELKDIGRSMRIEKRNQKKKRSLGNVSDKEFGSTSGVSPKRRKASSASDKVKNPNSSPSTAVRSKSKASHKRDNCDAQMKKNKSSQDKIQPTRTSSRTIKTPTRLAYEQALEATYAAFTSAKKRKSNDSSTTAFSPGGRATRAAKEQAIKSLTKSIETTQNGKESGKNGKVGKYRGKSERRKQTRNNLFQNKTRKAQTPNIQDDENVESIDNDEDPTDGVRRAKKHALRSLRTRITNDDDDDDDWEENKLKHVKSNRKSESLTSDVDIWETRFQSLVEFKEKKGHCLVPKVYPENRQLSYWVFRQRGLYSNRTKNKGGNNLTEERFQRLKDIGFVFKAKHSKEQNKVDAERRKPQLDAKWNRFYQEFCKYKEKTGSCLIPKVYEENQPLSSW